MSAKKTYRDDQFSTEEKKRVSSQTLRRDMESEEVNRLKRKIEELQNALCTAFDDNDNLRNQLALMEATLDLARTDNEQKDLVIDRLRVVIRTCQFIEAKNQQHSSSSLIRRRSI